MHFSLRFILFVLLQSASLEHESKEQDEETFVSTVDVDVNAPALSMIMSDESGGLSPKALSEVHNLAKDISHAKGIYREKDTSDANLEIRRSVLQKIAVQSESDVLNDLLKSFHEVEHKLQLLEQMEFLVHQYDVAVNFATQGGIQMITPLLSSSEDRIVSSVASVLGAAMQSNPTVQNVAVECKVGKDLLKLLSHPSPVVIGRILFALSCLLRNARKAQEEFLSLDGVSKLVDLLQNDQISTNSKLKIINLFSDLAVEQQTVQLYPSDQDSKLEKLFANEIQRCGICKIIPSFLDFEDYDTHQKIVSAMTSVHRFCHKDFRKEPIKERLKKLVQFYNPDWEHSLMDQDLKRLLHEDLSTLYLEINKGSAKMEL